MKKWIFTILVLSLLFITFDFVLAQPIGNDTSAQAQEFYKCKIELNFFYSPICPHCDQEKKFLDELENKYSEIKVSRFNTFERENTILLKRLYQDYATPSEDQGWVPIIFIGNKYFLSFDERIAQDIENYILKLIEENFQEPCEPEQSEKRISLPFIGEINVSKLSPLTLAIVLGVLDGFNACAMVALGFLLAVLVATGIRKRVFLIGGTFILVSGIVYFLFISAWLNLFLVFEQMKLITYLVGIIIILFSIFLLKDYFHGVICKLCQAEIGKDNIFTRLERKLFVKMEKISTSKMSLLLILGGTAIVAAGVNLVELVCSFGFPLAFTKILTSWQLSTSSYYFYLLIYIIFYMLDDFLIFTIAIFTLRVTQVSQKYLKAIKLISGIFLLALGLIMIFYPELLMFS